MAKFGQGDLLARFKKVDAGSLTLHTPADQLKGLFTEASREPENIKPAELDPNSIYIVPNTEIKKKKPSQTHVKLGKHDSQEDHEERQKVYRPGPFAQFYELNEKKLEKDEPVWYYKEHKEIVGPVSSYNMDKMVYFRTVQDDTKVAFKSVDKFVKFKKIKNILEDEKQNHQEQ